MLPNEGKRADMGAPSSALRPKLRPLQNRQAAITTSRLHTPVPMWYTITTCILTMARERRALIAERCLRYAVAVYGCSEIKFHVASTTGLRVLTTLDDISYQLYLGSSYRQYRSTPCNELNRTVGRVGNEI